ncbi:EAL and HDOD domain-containing protein [Glaciecola sp. SC05]|uniref:EAL and HDOD domain-containing protein n=1 Tax=Glaciecola sp. SC05 TaxID=1987355 RepID=UPI003528155E
MIVFAREPIFDEKQRLFAYQLVFRDGEEGALPELLPELNEETAEANTSVSIGLEELLSGFVSVISITRQTVLQGLPADFTPQDTVLEIPGIEASDIELIEAVKSLRQQGYRISIQNDRTLDTINFDLADYLKININHISRQTLSQLQQDISAHDIATIATNVQNPEQYQKCVDAGFHYFQGYFFLSRQHKTQKELPANKLSLLSLLAQTSDANIDMDKIRSTFEHDATLSYLLMRFINNPLINKSHKITSIKHALTYLGELMLRKFAAIVSIAQLNQDNVQELLQVSLVRAKYCELIDAELTDSQDAMSAFMAGLFSLIDVILDRDMAELLEQIPISASINEALLEQTGPYYSILASVKSLESSSWLPFKKAAKDLNIEEEDLHKYYLEAVKWNNLLHQSQSNMFPQAKP